MNTKKLTNWALVAVLLVPVVANATIFADWNDHRYVLVQTDEPLQWEDAADAAADALGGSLVRIDSAEENLFVFNFITSALDYSGKNANQDGFRWYWLGGYRYVQDPMTGGTLDNNPGDYWAWAPADGEDPNTLHWDGSTYTPWYGPEPNNGVNDTTGYRYGLQNYLHFDPRSVDTNGDLIAGGPWWDDVHQYGKTWTGQYDQDNNPIFCTNDPLDPYYKPGCDAADAWGMRGYIIEYSYLAPVPAPTPLVLMPPVLLALAVARRRRLRAGRIRQQRPGGS